MSTVHRTIQVLDLLSRRGALGVRAVANGLGLPVGSVHRLLNDLAEEQVVERDADGAWKLAHRLLGIVDRQLESVGFHRLAHPFCEVIAAEVGETVNVNVLSGDGCVVIDKVRSNDRMQLDWRVGSRGPLYCGGSGKAVLAYLSPAERRRIASQPMPGFTPHTITTSEGLLDELGRIRARGYSIDNQEIVMGVFCVAVPVLNRDGRPVGAVSISGPSTKAPGGEVMPLVARLNEVCGHVSQSLGYAGAWPPLDPQADHTEGDLACAQHG
ncbi:IclR family transcriptional regulator [Devosia sp.]|uniref:IclR family transcriptional regulator n=1 Tax=Devosia sp. TaxID=1871048 RepID=UPI003A92195A